MRGIYSDAPDVGFANLMRRNSATAFIGKRLRLWAHYLAQPTNLAFTA